jgi:hypothetical protein
MAERRLPDGIILRCPLRLALADGHGLLLSRAAAQAEEVLSALARAAEPAPS